MTAAAEAGLDGCVCSLVSRSSRAVWPNAHCQTNLQQPIALMGPLTWGFLLHPLGITALPKMSRICNSLLILIVDFWNSWSILREIWNGWEALTYFFGKPVRKKGAQRICAGQTLFSNTDGDVNLVLLHCASEWALWSLSSEGLRGVSLELWWPELGQPRDLSAHHPNNCADQTPNNYFISRWHNLSWSHMPVRTGFRW